MDARSERLSLADRTWLRMDAPDDPMVITGFMTFAEPATRAAAPSSSTPPRHRRWGRADRAAARPFEHPGRGGRAPREAKPGEAEPPRRDPRRGVGRPHPAAVVGPRNATEREAGPTKRAAWSSAMSLATLKAGRRHDRQPLRPGVPRAAARHRASGGAARGDRAKDPRPQGRP